MNAVMLGSPRPRIPIWAAEGALLVFWGLAAPVALIAPKALQILVWLLPLASLAVVARGGLGLRLLTWRPIYAVMAIPLAALLSAPVSVDPMESVGRAIRMIAEFAALCLLITSTLALPEDLRRRLTRSATLGVTLAAGLILLDVATRGAVLTPFWGPPTSWEWRKIGYNRGETTIAMLLPLAGLALALGAGRLGRTGLALAALAFGVAAVWAGASNSAKVATVAACVVFLIVYAAPALLRVLLWGCAVLVLAMPWALDASPPRPMIEQSSASLQSIVHRTIIWEFTISKIKERPVLGWGLDASRRMPGGDQEIAVSGFNKAGGPESTRVEMTGQIMPLHPHNGALQIWLELGALGAALTAGLMILAAESLRKLRFSRAAAAASAASVTAGFLVALVSYGIWQGWWLSALFMMATLPALARSE